MALSLLVLFRKLNALALDRVRLLPEPLMFGGAGSSGLLQDTWQWDSAGWTELTPPEGNPPARQLHAMAFDPGRNRLVLFGGFDGSDRLDDTWEWNAEDERWVEIIPDGPSPEARAGHSMTNTSSGPLIFGGSATSTELLGDTWAWNESRWTPLEGTGPAARSSTALAYDSGRDCVVLFGGGSGADVLQDTWEYWGAGEISDPGSPTGGGCGCSSRELGSGVDASWPAIGVLAVRRRRRRERRARV